MIKEGILTMSWYFGAWGEPGHYLWTMMKSRIWNDRDLPDDFPLRWKSLDCSLLPPRQPETQGRCHVWHTKGWSILTFWDRTCDSRGGSCSAFVLKTSVQPTDKELVDTFREEFREVANRVGKLILPDGTEV